MELSVVDRPGAGEVESIRRMPSLVQEFIADAHSECPDFLCGYLLPVLEEYVCPEDKIEHDLALAAYFVECEDSGLAGVGEYHSFGDLGISMKSIKKSLKKVVKKIAAPARKIMEKVVPKPIQNLQKKVAKFGGRLEKKTEKVASNIGTRYGNVLISAAGAILAIPTGGASVAAAAALVAANNAYKAKRAADKARKLGKANAAPLQAAATAAQAETMAQLDAFFNQNQQLFLTNLGITPAAWAAMTLQQKIDAIRRVGTAGSSGSQPPTGTQPPGGGYTPPGQPPGGYAPPYSGGGGAPPSSGGGGGGGGFYPEGSGPSGGFAPYQPGATPGQQVATSSMFSSSMLPVLAAGAALALVFGKPAKGGGRRAKRNPGRRRRRVA